MKLILAGTSALFVVSGFSLHAQVNNTPTPVVPSPAAFFVAQAPDARSSGMGEAGVASSADVNASFWNASKLPYAEKDFGVSASYTPWLRNLADDMWLGYFSAYKKLDDKQTVSASVNYFQNQGIENAGSPQTIHAYTARSYALSGTYARQLGKNFSMGFTLKYLSSDMGLRAPLTSPALTKPGRTVAGDLSAYYRKQKKDEATGGEQTWSFGAVIANVGGKIVDGSAYTSENFLPATLKLGAGWSYTRTGRHRFNFILDASKLAIPVYDDVTGISTKSTFKGIVDSFSDSPDGFRGEMKEIVLAGGAEYWYDNTYALRGGYHGESEVMGGRKYFTAGAGVRILKTYAVDFSYSIPAGNGNPLANTFRTTVSVYLGKKRV